ncbi:hypothetical protein ACFSSA_15630 [Luteolibacter algae]|uniref:Uncharacterized protein n=1 Tax=Luteolibacter algae TaxID=454151 RepID=A0ABW5DEP0_9BACT
MSYRGIIAILALIASGAHAEQKGDILRFTNGDQLHGSYSGITTEGGVLWERVDIDNAVTFKASELRQIVLNGEHPKTALSGLSHIGTVNGDRIPGLVRDLDNTRLLLETEFAGLLEIPRNQVGLVAPGPLSGRLLYQGPFSAAEWTQVSHEFPAGLPPMEAGNDAGNKSPMWAFSGSAWYWQNEKVGTALARKDGMPDRSTLQFEVAWKNRLSLAVAFHADFVIPKMKNPEEQKDLIRPGQPASLPGLFGEGYVMHLYSNYVMLYRTAFDEEGRPRLERVQTNNINVRLGESGSARVEIRCNRNSGEIVLFVNGEFVVQWSELNAGDHPEEGYAGRGNGYGFVVQAENSPARISEIVVAEWNGMPDAARSMQVDDQDIVLMTNGTDRFSGTIEGIHSGELVLSGRYGKFSFPMEDVAEIRFAKSKLLQAEENHDTSMKVRLYPIGQISGEPRGGNENELRLFNSAVGDLNMSLDSATMLEFRSTGNFLDNWNVDF